MMKRVIMIILLLMTVLIPVAYVSAASNVPAEIKLVDVSVTAIVEKFDGNQNRLWIRLADDNGTIAEPYIIKNNSAGIYRISSNSGDYQIYVDTKGNTQVRACYIMSFAQNTR